MKKAAMIVTRTTMARTTPIMMGVSFVVEILLLASVGVTVDPRVLISVADDRDARGGGAHERNSQHEV